MPDNFSLSHTSILELCIYPKTMSLLQYGHFIKTNSPFKKTNCGNSMCVGMRDPQGYVESSSILHTDNNDQCS